MTQDIIVELYGKVVRLEINCGTHKEIGFGKYLGELIRCKDCKYYRREIDMCDYQFETAHNVVYEDDFCSHAERKEE